MSLVRKFGPKEYLEVIAGLQTEFSGKILNIPLDVLIKGKPIILNMPDDETSWWIVGSGLDKNGLPINHEIAAHTTLGINFNEAQHVLPYHFAFKWNGKHVQFWPENSSIIMLGKPHNPDNPNAKRLLAIVHGDPKRAENRFDQNIEPRSSLIVQAGGAVMRFHNTANLPEEFGALKVVIGVPENERLTLES